MADIDMNLPQAGKLQGLEQQRQDLRVAFNTLVPV